MADQHLLHQAVRLHQAGRLDEAEALYHRLLQSEPDNADALNLLGVLARQQARPAAAAELVRRAVALRGDVADFHFNLGEACRALGELADATAAYEKALQLGGPDPEVYHGLGAALAGSGKDAQAMDALRQALQLQPGLLPAYGDLAACLLRQGRLDEATVTCRQALSIGPGDATSHFNFGAVLAARGEYEAAAAAYGRATELRPGWVQALVAAAGVLHSMGRLGEAEAHCRRAIKLEPGSADAHNVLGIALNKQGRITDAAAAFARAAQLRPDHAEAYANIANAMKQQGRHAEAEAAQRRAMELSPHSPSIHSNWLMLLNYVEDSDAAEVFAEHTRWATTHAAPPAAPSASPSPSPAGSPFADGPRADPDRGADLDPDRPLRVGYVSPDLRAHPIPFFLEPILSCHDPAQCRPIVYSDVARPDPVTRRLKQLAPAWRDVRPLSHSQLADLVRRDRVDVLVDLAGHTAEHRLLMFARVPAPVQVTYLGYPNTTGMPRSQMHYRLTDALADPPGIADTLHTEELVRLPDVFLCYRPPDDAPGVAPQPHDATGRATFGSFNTLEKVTAAQIALWAQILRQVAGARMLLKNKSLGDAGVRDRVRAAFAAHGVGAERLVLAGPEPEPARHLARYHDVDVALDTFPYGGTTTTCEALWMGVPVVTLAGPTHRSRVGFTLLSAVGLSELIATTPQQYVDLAVTLAGEPARLRALRDSLRERVRHSPLTDARRFTENLESAYRQMWRAHCSRGATGAGAP